jgi:choline dehydrogenase-like flavoprotein
MSAERLTEAQRSALRAVCDTVVPSIDHEPDPHGLWRRRASDLGVDTAMEDVIVELPPVQREGMLELLDGLAAQGIDRVSLRSRGQLLTNVTLLGKDALAGVGALVGLALFLNYGAPDPETGQNPNWEVYGYPGPISGPPDVPKAIRPTEPEKDELRLEADVCIVGSGAGGGVIAGTLAERGLKVCVLEAAGYFNESDFNMLELWAYQNMYWRGGPQQTADMNVTLMAGTTLGGGTTINWQNSLRTFPWVREQWAREHGLEGLDGPEYDSHLDAVLERVSATDKCSHLNGPQQRMKEAAEQLGWSHRTIVRNTDASKYDPATAAYIGFGDQTGAKQGTLKTYLQDAFERDADMVVRCFVERVLVEKGRAAGVEGTWTDPASGRSAKVTVRAPQVVVACGSLESPALLLRSGIGGAAAGKHLRLHPVTGVFGIYPEDQKAWWGPPQALLCDEFANIEGGYGFLIETSQYAPALIGSSLPFMDAAEHKKMMEKTRFGATFIGLVRDRGDANGYVTIDGNGQAVPYYAVADELDIRNSHSAIDAQARMHLAAGALEMHALAPGIEGWRWGDDLDAWIASAQRAPLGFGGWRMFSAHQMGTCRMGADPATSVANPWGELHDTPGVWIGDGSGFPTASGTNPMITIMALAHRTAGAIAASARPAGVPAGAVAK